MFREIMASQMRLKRRLERQRFEEALEYPHNKSKSSSFGTLGGIEIARLERDGLIIFAEAKENGEPFWAEETQDLADAIENEAAFTAFITPLFDKILHRCGMVFVNSERYEWLSQSSVLKPDGFATHPGMFRTRPVPSDEVVRPNGFRFGEAEKELFDCLILFESKLTVTPAAFGQEVRYLQKLCPRASASAILLYRRSFWLIKSYKSVVTRVQQAKLVDKGSKSLFQNFITSNMSPWVALLTNACSSLGVDVVEGDAFLGRGAHGRVFKVSRQDGEVSALKVTEEGSVEHLHREVSAMAIAQRTGLTISPVGELIETVDGAALLLSPVGKRLPRPTTRGGVRKLFEMLWQLHENDVAHGDPRVANVILNGKEPLWIDLAEIIGVTPTLMLIFSHGPSSRWV
ncbi:Protein kinase, ATP binding site [Phytophthora cactorum]|nr:Protein kinase, ATP binding site [Phytophthora cactorum]